MEKNMTELLSQLLERFYPLFREVLEDEELAWVATRSVVANLIATTQTEESFRRPKAA